MQRIAVPFFLALPWLTAYTAGPLPNAWPWLLAAFCALGGCLFARHLKPEQMASSWLLAAVISAGIALIQYFDADQFLGAWVSQARPGEAFANLRQRNQFASLTSIGLLGLFAWLGHRTPQRPFPVWVFPVAVLLALGNAASGSRTGLLQWFLILALMFWWNFSTRRVLVMLAARIVGVYLLGLVLLPWLLNWTLGFTGDSVVARMLEAPTCASRLVLWSNVGSLIAEKPWVGWGWGELDYAHFMAAYPGERFCDILDNAHNLPLHLAVELGIPAAVLFCVAVLWAVLAGKPWREKDPWRQMAWSILAVIGLHSLLEYPLWYGPFQLATGLCVFLLLKKPHEPQSLADGRGRRSFAIRATVGSLLMAGLTYTAWDYHRVSQIYLDPGARDLSYRQDTLNKISDSWLFRNQVRFAALATTPLSRDNAEWTFQTAQALLHYSPEPRVVEKAIESAVMLGRDQEALVYLMRYRAAFPQNHEKWRRENRLGSDTPE